MTFFLFVLLIIDNGMKAENPSSSAHQFVRVRRSDAVRRLIQRDKTPLAVLKTQASVALASDDPQLWRESLQAMRATLDDTVLLRSGCCSWRR